jgi:hypothetical protein
VLGWQALCPGVRSPAQLCDTEQASSLHWASAHKMMMSTLKSRKIKYDSVKQ